MDIVNSENYLLHILLVIGVIIPLILLPRMDIPVVYSKKFNINELLIVVSGVAVGYSLFNIFFS